MNTYKSRTEPMEHQAAIMARLKDARYFALFWEMGCGKTKPIIDDFGSKWMEGEIDCVLIISDKGCYRNWSEVEIPRHLDPTVEWVSCLWRSGIGKRESREFFGTLSHTRRLPVVSMNVDALITRDGKAMLDTLIRTRKLIYCVIDESSSIKTHSAQRTKMAWRIASRMAYRRILTGTPMTKDICDLYSQYFFLNPAAIGQPTFYGFKARYCREETQWAGPRSYKVIVGFQNTDELMTKVAYCTSRLLKTDCLTLPPKLYSTRTFELSKDQREAYKVMQEKAMLLLDNAQTATALNALSMMMKLRQICCGRIMTDDRKALPIPGPQPRLIELVRICEEIQGKALIWCAFQGDVEQVVAVLNKVYGPGSAVDYYGKTSDEDRSDNLKAFTGGGARFFVGTPETGGKSLTLVQATTVIYYSNGFNLANRLQSEDRAHRIGQVNPVLYIDLVAEDTVDVAVVEALQNKRDLVSETLQTLKNIIKRNHETGLQGTVGGGEAEPACETCAAD